MPKDNENVPLISGDLPASVEPRAFTEDQMVRCEQCLRANPPTRTNCLYCSKPLPISETSFNLQKPSFRPLEKWEQGYNNIWLPRSANPDESSIRDAADFLKLHADDLARVFKSETALPLARTADIDEASLVQRHLRTLGIETLIVADDDLGLGQLPPFRVRSMEIGEAGTNLFQRPGVPGSYVPWSDFLLIVHGRLVVKRAELKEKKSKRGENQILDASEFFADELVVDLYTRNAKDPSRIVASGFDFSCLGRQKHLLAKENISELLKVFRDYAPHAQQDDSYQAVRRALDTVWPWERQNESRGLQRERPGKFSIGTASELSNETQFLRYSRLRNYLQQNATSF